MGQIKVPARSSNLRPINDSPILLSLFLHFDDIDLRLEQLVQLRRHFVIEVLGFVFLAKVQIFHTQVLTKPNAQMFEESYTTYCFFLTLLDLVDPGITLNSVLLIFLYCMFWSSGTARVLLDCSFRFRLEIRQN